MTVTYRCPVCGKERDIPTSPAMALKEIPCSLPVHDGVTPVCPGMMTIEEAP